jgi:hypothetical protein
MDDPKQTLINGKPADEVENENADSGLDQGSGDLPSEGDSGHSPEPPRADGIPGSGEEIKDRARKVVERLKTDGPAPAREAAKGLIDKAFDAVDAGFDRWFGKKE